ncbi:hypothetical protein V6N13_112709 [Hibiscus sabdariffa]
MTLWMDINDIENGLILATEGNWEYTMRRIKFIYDLRPDKTPECNKTCVLVLQYLQQNQGKRYEHFSPVPDFTDRIRRGLIRNFFCRQALQMVLNIAARNDSWFRQYGLHSEVVQPELFPEPNAATMKVDLSVESAILPFDPSYFASMITDVRTWSDIFSDIVLRGASEKLYATAPDIPDIQRVTADIFFKPRGTREKLTFTRFRKEIGRNMWAVIDFDLDAFTARPSRKATAENTWRRRPSGVIIGNYDDINTKVIWIENMEVLVNSEWPYKASNWINVLKILNHERDYSLSYYMRLADSDCPEFMQYGRCKDVMCLFNHPGRRF